MIILLSRHGEGSGVPPAATGRSRSLRWIALPCAVVAGVLAGWMSSLEAQDVQEMDVPTIEPHFTRIHMVEERLSFPSLSPDGRWIAFAKDGLWLVPAEGGHAIRLTQGGDSHPVWFPSGDRIAFRSDRPSRGGNGGLYVMTLPIDPDTGRPTGPPRQVSIEKVFSYLDVSPDGEWIAFTGWSSGQAVLVVPSAGGRSRLVARAEPWRPAWGPDGKSIYYTVGHPLGEALVRVSVEGNKVDTVFTWPESIVTFGSPESRILLRGISGWADGPSVMEVATLEGVPLGRLELPPGMDAMSATPGGQELVALQIDRDAPLEILAIDGGPPLRLNETRGHDKVLGWTPDGERVLFKTTLDGGEAFFFASTSGGPMRQVRFPERPLDEFPPVLSADGQHLLYAVGEEDGNATTLRVLDLQNGRSREISRSPLLPGSGFSEPLSGRGGTFWRDGNDFLYVERHGDDFELRAAPPGGPSRLLRTFRGKLSGRIAVHGNRIAYRQQRAYRKDPSVDPERGTLMLARAGEEEAQPLLTLQDYYLQSVTWSWDGTRLALSTDRMDPESHSPLGMELLVLEIGASGEVIGEPSVLSTPAGVFWSPRWLPDDRSLLVPGWNANVWRISADPDARPVNVTSDLPGPVYRGSFRLSPDGRFIAYGAGTLRGSSIWRVDLGDALAGYER